MYYKELCNVVEASIDYAFEGKFMLNMYEYLTDSKATKVEVQEFINGPTAQNINTIVYDLEEYLEGGSDDTHKQLREAYGYLGKPEARKIKNYLHGILEDAWKYEQTKKPGRKKKSSK